MQSGYTKLCYFLCEWDSQGKDKHYKITDWPKRDISVSGENFVKSMNKHVKDFRDKFPKLSYAELKDGIFL
jgi:hypothetical protein